MFNLLGDPSLELWRKAPARVDADQLHLGQDAARVAVASGQPGLNGATATLRRDGVAVGRALIENGTASIDPEDGGGLDGTLTVAIDGAGLLALELPVPAAAAPAVTPTSTATPLVTPTPSPVTTTLTQQCPASGAVGQTITITGRLPRPLAPAHRSACAGSVPPAGSSRTP